jgi:hypothetical protein
MNTCSELSDEQMQTTSMTKSVFHTHTHTGTDETDSNEIAEIEIHMNISKSQKYT